MLDDTKPVIQVTGRTISLSYPPAEMEEVNHLLKLIQESGKFNEKSLKGLYLEVLRNSLNSDSNSIEINELIHENAELKESNQNVLDANLKLTEEKDGLILKLEQSIDEVNTLKKELELTGEVDVITVEKEFQPNDTDIFLVCTPIQSEALKRIAQNRFDSKRETSLLTISEMARKLLFNKGTLFNFSGEMWTGLKYSESKKMG